jgi:CheY-like chemotaxis protein
MRPPVLIVAPQSLTLLGLAQAMLKFGYQITTAYPDPAELERVEKIKPTIVVLRPPLEEEQRDLCLREIKQRFHDRGIPVLVCVTDQDEERSVRDRLGDVVTLVGSPLRLNELYAQLQVIFRTARRAELRISTELVVAHREPGLTAKDFYDYDTLTSLSLNGCFIKTETPYPMDSAIEMVFCIGSAAASFKISGTVRRVGEGGGQDQGMGVTFEHVSEDTLRRLETFLMGHLGTMDMPATL